MKEAGSSHSAVTGDLRDNTDVTDSVPPEEDSSDMSDVVVVLDDWLVVFNVVVVVEVMLVVVDVVVEVLVVEVKFVSCDWLDMVQLL